MDLCLREVLRQQRLVARNRRAYDACDAPEERSRAACIAGTLAALQRCGECSYGALAAASSDAFQGVAGASAVAPSAGAAVGGGDAGGDAAQCDRLCGTITFFADSADFHAALDARSCLNAATDPLAAATPVPRLLAAATAPAAAAALTEAPRGSSQHAVESASAEGVEGVAPDGSEAAWPCSVPLAFKGSLPPALEAVALGGWRWAIVTERHHGTLRDVVTARCGHGATAMPPGPARAQRILREVASCVRALHDGGLF